MTAHGVEADEINAALVWLDGLHLAAQSSRGAPDPAEPVEISMLEQAATSMRVYSIAEQGQLGAECLGFIYFLESSGVLPAAMREIVLDRAMAVPGAPVLLDDLKVIVLMVYWSFGEEPDALVLDERCDVAVVRRHVGGLGRATTRAVGASRRMCGATVGRRTRSGQAGLVCAQDLGRSVIGEDVREALLSHGSEVRADAEHALTTDGPCSTIPRG